MFGQPVRMRVRIHSDAHKRSLHHLLVYAGDPAAGGEVIAGKTVHGIVGERGRYVWIEWMPRKLGKYTLHAVLLEHPDDPRQGNHWDTLRVRVVNPPRTVTSKAAYWRRGPGGVMRPSDAP